MPPCPGLKCSILGKAPSPCPKYITEGKYFCTDCSGERGGYAFKKIQKTFVGVSRSKFKFHFSGKVLKFDLQPKFKTLPEELNSQAECIPDNVDRPDFVICRHIVVHVEEKNLFVGYLSVDKTILLEIRNTRYDYTEDLKEKKNEEINEFIKNFNDNILKRIINIYYDKFGWLFKNPKNEITTFIVNPKWLVTSHTIRDRP